MNKIEENTPIIVGVGQYTQKVPDDLAKALSHEPTILFLDEPSSGVDVDLRKSMWQYVRKLRKTGVTIFLTTSLIKRLIYF